MDIAKKLNGILNRTTEKRYENFITTIADSDVISHYDLLIDENNDPGTIRSQIENSGLCLTKTLETENAYIFVSEKR